MLHDWYQKGYISKDAGTNTENWRTVCKAGNLFSLFFAYHPGTPVEFQSSTGYEFEIVPFYDQPIINSSSYGGIIFSVAQNSENPEKAREDARIHFMVGDLSYLEIGGRIGKVATISAGLLKIKPIIILKGGEISAGGICRARKKGLTQIASITAKHFKETGENPAHYIAMPGTNTIWDDMDSFYTLLQETVLGKIRTLFANPFCPKSISYSPQNNTD